MLFNTLLDSGADGLSIGLAPVIIIFAVFILWEFFRGMRRGVVRQIVHTLCAIAAGVIAFLATQNICQNVLNEFDAQTVEDILAYLETNGAAEKLGMSADAFMGLSSHLQNADLILALPLGTVLVPVLFALVFLLILVASKLVSFLVRLLLHLPKGKGLGKRLSGAVIGAVEGAVVCAMLFIPVIAIFSMVDSGVEMIREKNDPVFAEFIEEYDEDASPFINNFVFKAIGAMGGNTMINRFATVEIDGKEVNLRDELIVGVSMAVELSAIEDADFKSLTEDEKQIISSAVDTLGASDYMSTFVSELLSAAAYIVDNGALPFDIEPPFDTLVDSVISLFKTSNKDNLEGDLDTILGVYYILSDEGVLTAVKGGNEQALTDALVSRGEDGETVVNKVIAELKKNDRTAPLVTTLSQLSIAMLADRLEIDGVTTEVYDNVTEDLENVLTIDRDDYASDDEYKAALTESIDTALSDNGIVLKDEIVSEMADLVDEEKKNNPDMTVDDIILTYYDAYLEHQESGNAE